MPTRGPGIRARTVNPRRGGEHRTGRLGRQRTMRLFYAIITMLLVLSLGLLEAVTP
jgi:hypothetical protein